MVPPESASLGQTPEIPILELPLIDGIDGSDRSDASGLAQLAQNIEQACRRTGFFYLRQTSLPQVQIDQAFVEAKAFFALPSALKMQVVRSPQTNCGYVPLQAEALDPSRAGDYKEAFNIGSDTVWSNLPSSFRAVLAEFYQSCIQQIAMPLLQAAALALDLPERFFVERHQNNFFLRLLYYPTLLPQAGSPPDPLRAGAHTDYGTLTLLFQEATVGGLEILTPQGDWLAAPAQPDTVLVNIGDALQRWTSDRWRSSAHRVLLPPAHPCRYSMALFCDPDPLVEIASLPNQPEALYPPILYRDYLQSRFAATYG